MVRTLEAAAAWVDEVGLALLFPKADVVLPSLWEQVNGSPARTGRSASADGTFVRWTEEMAFLWGAKDELPAQGLVCVGKHVARVATCVAPRLLPLLVAAAEPVELAPTSRRSSRAITGEGALTGPQLRELTGLPKRELDRIVAGAAPQARAHERASRRAGRPVGRDRARPRSRASGGCRNGCPTATMRAASSRDVVLEQAGELTAADLAGPFGWRRREAAALLEAVATGRDADGFRIWTPHLDSSL